MYSALAISIYFLVDAMNMQVHSSTGSSPSELVFGQKPRAVLFPKNSDEVDVVFEEDLERDGVVFDDNSDVTCQRQAYSFQHRVNLGKHYQTQLHHALQCTEPLDRACHYPLPINTGVHFVHLSRCSHPPPLPYIRPVLSHPNVHLGRYSRPPPPHFLYVGPLIQSLSLSHPNIHLGRYSRPPPPPLLYVGPLIQSPSLSHPNIHLGRFNCPPPFLLKVIVWEHF